MIGHQRCSSGLLALALSAVAGSQAFLLPGRLASPGLVRLGTQPAVSGRRAHRVPVVLGATSPASTGSETSKRSDLVRERLSQEWELDCYSRPVIGSDGKKLWELLICDSLGEFRRVEQMPSNMVNSREVRKLVEKVSDVSAMPAAVYGGARSLWSLSSRKSFARRWWMRPR
jgi:hypothetical protein